MKYLIVDDCAHTRWLLKKRLLQKWPDAEIEEYDPALSGLPGPQYPWSRHDIVLLDYDLGLDAETGIDLLVRIKDSARPPIVIMITGMGNENVAVKAIRKGADDYLVKNDVATDRLFDMISDAVRAREAIDHTEGDMEDVRRELGDWNIPGYRCLAVVSKGFTTTTLRAERLSDHKPVILKVLQIQDNPGNRTAIKRFSQEIEILSNLHHPHVIEILDHGVIPNQIYYYATEYIHLGDLARSIERGEVTTAKALDYIFQIIDGLKALHERNIVHRDIKPSNILFKDRETLVIADLGIAKNLSAPETLTIMGDILGTPYYISPEQINNKPVDQRTDIYSLGVMLYELLTGTVPYPGNSLFAVVYQHNHEPVPKLPTALTCYQPVLERMLAKSPEQRYANLDEVMDALAAAQTLKAASR
ncbi:MAG TPA: protein kinase [Gammaproteobacteria bacterium]|nr:protein kinase [Gammaproteobacteria bacterium]